MTIQDWGVTYEELEPYYDKFEYLCGISGQAGNIQGRIQDGGNPFEGPRSRGYPLPPLMRSAGTVLFDQAARELGLKPFACPAANTSRALPEPARRADGAVHLLRLLRVVRLRQLFEGLAADDDPAGAAEEQELLVRTRCDVTRVNLDGTGKRATGVTYVDGEGHEYEQPADLVVLCAFAQHNVHLLLLSGIGKTYDPQGNTGVVGRNYAYQITSSVDVFVDEHDESVHGRRRARPGGRRIQRRQLRPRPGRLRRRRLHRPVDHRRAADPADTTCRRERRSGAGWKKAMAENYLKSASIATHGSVMSYRDSYLDLDPTYRDIYGNPLLRLTFDFHDNEHRMSRFVTDKAMLTSPRR